MMAWDLLPQINPLLWLLSFLLSPPRKVTNHLFTHINDVKLEKFPLLL